jgi:alcohol dehydrogenase
VVALLQLARSGHMMPVVDKVLKLEDIREAERLMEEREVFGKIVVMP